MADKIQVELSLEEQKALRAITSLTKKVDDFGKGASKSISRADVAIANFTANLAASAVKKGLSLIADGFSAIVNNVGNFINAANQQEKAVNDLNLALATTGQFSKTASRDLQSYASELQNLTGVGDEVILQSQALLQNFAKLSVDGLKQVTPAVIDFSKALNIDLQTASKLVGRALNGQTEALKRYGIEVQKGANEQETFNNVLSALGRFSGAAEANLNTFSGALGAAQGRFGDLQEILGEFITKNPAVISAIKAIDKAIVAFSDQISKNTDSINGFVDSVVFGLIDGIELAGEAFIRLREYFAGAEILKVFVEQAFFAIENSIRSFSVVVAETLNRLRTFAKFDPSEGLTNYIESQKALIEVNKDVNKQFAQDIKIIQDRTNAQNRAIRSFTKTLAEETRSGLAEQKKIIENANEDLFNQISASTSTQIALERQRQEEISLLKQAFAEKERQDQENQTLLQELRAQEEFQFLAKRLGEEEALREFSRAKELQAQGNHDAAVLSLSAARAKAEKQDIFSVQKFEEFSYQQRLANLKSTLGTVASLQSQSNSTLFNIGKAAAISTATIDGIQAVQKALASAPPPFNFALAATVGVATGANIAKIASQRPPRFERGGIVGGSSFSGDRVIARVNSGEMILNRQQQANLFNMANGSGSGNLESAITRLGDRIANMKIVVEANSREIARLVRDEQQTGFAI